jgi:hypothetical protein
MCTYPGELTTAVWRINLQTRQAAIIERPLRGDSIRDPATEQDVIP